MDSRIYYPVDAQGVLWIETYGQYLDRVEHSSEERGTPYDTYRTPGRVFPVNWWKRLIREAMAEAIPPSAPERAAAVPWEEKLNPRVVGAIALFIFIASIRLIF